MPTRICTLWLRNKLGTRDFLQMHSYQLDLHMGRVPSMSREIGYRVVIVIIYQYQCTFTSEKCFKPYDWGYVLMCDSEQ